MKTAARAGHLAAIAALAMLVVSPSWLASQAPPAGARFLCKDGAYSTAATVTQACLQHGGVTKPLGAPAAAPAPAMAPVAVAAPRPAQERGAFGLGIGYASFATSYWFYGGGNSAWQAWSQFQLSGFFDGRAPLRIGASQTRFRIEARVGTGGATNNVGSGYVGNGASLTNGSLSGGLAATLRLPLSASTGTHPKPFVGLGLDYSVLWGFGDNSGSIYGKGWNERLLTVPLLAGVILYTEHLTFRPEFRYAFIGSSSSNLYLSGAGQAMQDKGPTMIAISMSVTWR